MKRTLGLRVGMFLCLALVLVVSAVWTGHAQRSGTPAGVDPATGATGKTFSMEATGLGVARRRFEAGARTAWHSHDRGQLIFVEEGRARTQKRGQQLKELGAGESDYTGPSVVHWHGSAPGQPLVQVAVSFGDGAKRMDPVTEEEYLGKAR